MAANRSVNTIQGFRANPLRVLSETQLENEVNRFAKENGLLDILHTLQQGAQIARDPNGSPVFQEIGGEDHQALIDENLHRLRHPLRYWIVIAFTCCAAALQGWAQIGFVPGSKRWEGLDPDESSGGQDWKIGLVSAIPYLVAAVCGCWLSEPLNQRYGRRVPLLVAAIVNLLSAFGAAVSQHWYQVLICRGITGIAMGLKASVAPILAAEVSSPSIRGSTVMGAWQVCVACGILFGYSTALVVNGFGEDYWRYQIAAPFLLSIPIICLFFVCEESPRWQIRKGQYRAAYNTLCRIRNRPIQAGRDLFAIAAQVRHEENLLGIDAANASYRKKFGQLFSDPRNRAATIAAAVIMFGQQLCGINAIIFFGFTLFSNDPDNASGRTDASLWAMWVVGFVNMVFGLPGLYLSDRIGRRRLLLWFYPPMFLFMLAAGLANMIPGSAKTWVVSVFIILFVASYSPAQGPCAFLYASESFPVTHREVGMSLSVAINLFWAGILAVTYPHMDTSLNDGERVNKPNYALIVFAFLNLLAMALVYLLCPETKLYTLEELDTIFAFRVRERVVEKFGDLRRLRVSDITGR